MKQGWKERLKDVKLEEDIKLVQSRKDNDRKKYLRRWSYAQNQERRFAVAWVTNNHFVTCIQLPKIKADVDTFLTFILSRCPANPSPRTRSTRRLTLGIMLWPQTPSRDWKQSQSVYNRRLVLLRLSFQLGVEIDTEMLSDTWAGSDFETKDIHERVMVVGRY